MAWTLIGMVCSECGNGTYVVVSLKGEKWIATCASCQAPWELLENGQIKLWEKDVIGQTAEVVNSGWVDPRTDPNDKRYAD